jgi:hypothetical protein
MEAPRRSVAGRQIQADPEVAAISLPAVPPADDLRGAGGDDAGMPGLLELLAILAGVLSAQVADRQPVDVDADGLVIVRVVVLEDQRSPDDLVRALLGSPAADPLRGVLVVGLADDIDRVGTDI